MLKYLKAAACIAILGLATQSSPASAAELTITTGGPKGTYYKFGENLKTLAETVDGLEIIVEQSNGSIENLRRLLGYEGAGEGQKKFYQLAIVQADVLQELRRQAESHEVLKEIADRIKVVMPLYAEEIHIIANADVEYNDASELLRDDVEISGGEVDSGSAWTTRTLYEELGGANPDIFLANFDLEEGLNLLKEYEVGAVVEVTGAPSQKLQEQITTGDGLKLIQFSGKSLISQENSPYVRAYIDDGTYGWQDKTVLTVGVLSLLVAFDYDKETAHCEAIGRLGREIAERIDEIRVFGHKKWQEVDVDAAFKRTDIYGCVLDAQ